MDAPAKFVFKGPDGRDVVREAYFLPCDRAGRTIHRNDFVLAADDRAWKVLAFEPGRGNSVLARRYDGCRRIERELSPRWLTLLLEDADAERILLERQAYNKAERTIPARWNAMAAACEGDDRLRGAVGYCRELAGDLLPVGYAGKRIQDC